MAAIESLHELKLALRPQHRWTLVSCGTTVSASGITSRGHRRKYTGLLSGPRRG
jgi:hypothetical protein